MMKERDEYLCKELRHGYKRVWNADTFPPELRVGHYPEGFFSTWAGFGVLWVWCKRQPWWGNHAHEWDEERILQSIIDPDIFADTIYGHLCWYDMLDANK
jgi:hypothetical protein